MRASGILLPIASLPSKYGIGAFSKSAYEFVDALRAAGQRYWQILPLGPTGYGDSSRSRFRCFHSKPSYIVNYFINIFALLRFFIFFC